MGGVERLAEALATGATRADPHRLSLLAKAFARPCTRSPAPARPDRRAPAVDCPPRPQRR
jgi:hypothetical protein